MIKEKVRKKIRKGRKKAFELVVLMIAGFCVIVGSAVSEYRNPDGSC